MTAQALFAGRLLQFAGILVLFGSSLFYLYGFAAGASERFSRPRPRWPRLILLVAALTGIAGVMMWVMAQTASISDDPADAFNPVIMFGILTETRFGRVCLLRLGLLAACLSFFWLLRFGKRLWLSLAVLSGVTIASFAWTGHGNADDGLVGIVHLGADVLHLVAAGVWLGALVPLAFLIKHSLQNANPADARATYDALESFSAMGVTVVGVLALSGIINSIFLIGWNHVAALLTTTYGLALSLKILLFGLMLLLAANNRYRLTPRLAQGIESSTTSSEVLGALRRSVIAETALGLLVLGAIAFLGTLEPPISADFGGAS